MANVNIDGTTYAMDSLDSKSQELIKRIVFIDKQIQWLNSELAVCDTARIGYSRSLKSEVSEPGGA